MYNDFPAVVFDSPGGSLLGGIKLGRQIRKYNFDTFLGTSYSEFVPRAKPSEEESERILSRNVVCASACVLAFIGGVKRTVDVHAKIGVHQFSSGASGNSEGGTQVAMTLLANYVDAMGVSRRMIDVASVVSSEKIFWLSLDEIKQLSIDNSTLKLSEWKILATQDGLPFGYVSQQINPGHYLDLFLSATQDGDLKFLIVKHYDLKNFPRRRLISFAKDQFLLELLRN